MTLYHRIAAALLLVSAAVLLWLIHAREDRPVQEWRTDYCLDARRPNLLCDGRRL